MVGQPTRQTEVNLPEVQIPQSAVVAFAESHSSQEYQQLSSAWEGGKKEYDKDILDRFGRHLEFRETRIRPGHNQRSLRPFTLPEQRNPTNFIMGKLTQWLTV